MFGSNPIYIYDTKRSYHIIYDKGREIKDKNILSYVYKQILRVENIRISIKNDIYMCATNILIPTPFPPLSLSLPLTKMILLPPPHHHHHSKTLLSLFLFLLVFSFSLPLIFPPCVFVDVLALALKRQYASPYIYS